MKRKVEGRFSSLFLIGVLAILFNPIAVSAALLTDVRLWSAPDHTRVVLDLTVPIQYESSVQDKTSHYCLSLSSATAVADKVLAARENMPNLSRGAFLRCLKRTT